MLAAQFAMPPLPRLRERAALTVVQDAIVLMRVTRAC